MRIALRLLSFAAFTAALAGCSLGDENKLELTVSVSNAVVSPGEAVRISVTAENVGSTRISWGHGSSTCQLHVVARVDGRDYLAPDITRICTADYVEMALDPGQGRTESFDWTGHIARDSLVMLPPGTYGIRGAAGDNWKSPPLSLQVVTP